jgi:hypothetical protein
MPRARPVTVSVGHRIHSLSPERFHAEVLPFLRTGDGTVER